MKLLKYLILILIVATMTSSINAENSDKTHINTETYELHNGDILTLTWNNERFMFAVKDNGLTDFRSYVSSITVYVESDWYPHDYFMFGSFDKLGHFGNYKVPEQCEVIGYDKHVCYYPRVLY